MSLLNKAVFLFLTSALLLTGCDEGPQDFSLFRPGVFSPSSISSTEEWFELYHKEKKIGYVHHITTPGNLDKKPATQLKSYARMEMSVAGETGLAVLDQTSYVDSENTLVGFEYSHTLLGHILSIKAYRDKNQLLAEIDTGEKQFKKYPFDSRLHTSATIIKSIKPGEMKPGEKVSFNIFLEPLFSVKKLDMTLNSVESRIVNGRETRVFHFTESFEGLTGELLLTEQGAIVEEISPLGFRMLKAVDAASALSNSGTLDIEELIAGTKVRTIGEIKNPRLKKSLKVRIKNIPSSYVPVNNLPYFSSKEKDFELIANIQAVGPIDGEILLPLKGRDFMPYLESDPVVNASNREIKEKSLEIIGSETSAIKASQLLYRWVNRNIKKRLVDSSSAIDTLKSGEGECQAHSNLLAALARAVGIPVRVVSGLVYSEEHRGFMYHAWNEVWVGSWMPVDATLGGFPADATHIRLAEGGPDAQLKLLPMIGKIEAEIIAGD